MAKPWSRLVGPLVLAVILAGAAARWQGWLSAGTYDLIFAAAMVPTFSSLLPRTGMPPARAVLLALAIGGGAAAATVIWPGLVLAPYLAVVAINLGVAWIFGRGLVPGRRPILLQLIELIDQGPAATPAFSRFVRGQCWLWLALGLAAGFAALIAMVSPSWRPVFGEVTGAVLVLQGAVFILSHYYANWRYRRPETWLITARAMAQPATWAAIRP